MSNAKAVSFHGLSRDLTASVVVFLVALPLCLGIALASNAPLFSGLVAGIVGGLVVGALSGSHTSVSGPAAGLTAVVAAQIASLGSFEAFLMAVVIAGLIQIGLGIARAGFIAAYFPTSVIKGLLAAIGTILILKQIPHLFGHDTDPDGEMSFVQPDQETTFSAFGEMLENLHPGAAFVGLLCLAVLIVWDRVPRLKKLVIPAPLVVVVLGVAANGILSRLVPGWAIEQAHLVQVPVAETLNQFFGFFTRPDFASWSNPTVYTAAFTIALVASLETLLNLEAVDKIDPRQRHSPPSRELLAQGVGNLTSGMLGGLPLTSVIVRSSVNINSGAETKVSAIVHGALLFICVLLAPTLLNSIPLSALAAILIVTGFKLASPKLVKQLWSEGPYQFIPFAVTVVAIVLTDLLVGILIGLGVAVSFILNSNLRVPIRRYVERHLSEEIIHIQLTEQVSFLKRAALAQALEDVPAGSHVLIDAEATDFIDPDILDLLHDYQEKTAPARQIEVSRVGFRDKYALDDRIGYIDYSTRELQSATTPEQVLDILKQGHHRFRQGKRLLSRDLSRQVNGTADSQHPLGVILSCIDSRVPTELIFDLGVGDVFSVRVAGNIPSRKILGSIEYGCAVAGAKLVVVMGHTRCGAVTEAVRLACSTVPIDEVTGCQHVEHVLTDIQECFDAEECRGIAEWPADERDAFIRDVVRRNVLRTVRALVERSESLASLVREGRLMIVGATYDVVTGDLHFMEDEALRDTTLALFLESPPDDGKPRAATH
jgi:carbonic anhydrase